MLRLPSMPSVTIQLELDHPSMPLDRTTFGPGTVLASFAEESRTAFREHRAPLGHPHAPRALSQDGPR